MENYMPEQNPTDLDFIEQVRQYSEDTQSVIEEAKRQFEECIVERQRGAGQIVKAWAKVIKNDPAKLELAYKYADEVGLLQTYTNMLAEGKSHRVCYRTAVVNSYIFSLMEQAQSDSLAVDDLLNELNEGGV